jgi:hypothetical protein
MPVIGINVRAIGARKDEEIVGSVKVNSNTNIKNIKDQEIPALKQKGLLIDFEFKTDYVNDKNKSVAEINISGNVLFIDEQMERITKEWKKDKKLPDDVNLQVINAILRKSIVKALSLSDELQLPPPIALPLAKKNEDKDSNYIG